MAVIRQKNQYFNRPIGVVRASTGNQKVAQAISNFADSVNEEVYKVAAEEAQDRGTKAAIAQDSANIVNIDPDTGRPVAYKPPSGYGTIAAKAYQNLIDKRFEDSVSSEIQQKGAELAASSSSAAQYRDRLSAYIGEMHSNAKAEDGQLNAYGRILKDTGEQYVASTYATLRKKEVAAQRAAVLRTNKVESFKQLQLVKDLISVDGDNKKIQELIAREESRNEELFNMPSGISFSDYAAKVKSINGLKALSANKSLVEIYSQVSDREKLLIKSAIANPTRASNVADQLGKKDLLSLITAARRSESASSIISGLDSIGSIDQSIEDSAVQLSVQELDVSADSILDDLYAKVNALDPSISPMVRTEVNKTFAIKKLDAADLSATQIDLITNQLLRSSPDYNEISSLLGGRDGAHLALALRGLDAEGRQEVSKMFSDVRPELGRLETEADQQKVNSINTDIIALKDAEDLIGSRDALHDKIMASGLENTKSLITAADEDFASYAIDRQRALDISYDKYSEITEKVRDGKAFSSDNPDEQEAYDLLKRAMEYAPASTSSAMGNKLETLKKTNEREVANAVLEANRQAVLNGNRIPRDQLEEVGEKILGQGPVVLSELQNPEEARMFNQGVVLPQVAKAMGLALDSNNEEEILAALQRFEQGVGTTNTLPNGRVVPADSMRNSLTEKDYSLYSALLFANRRHREDPADLLSQMRNFDGNLEEELKKDLGIKASAGLDRAFGDAFFSPRFKREIIDTAKVIRARGGKMDQDVFDRIVERYTEGMVQDDRIFGESADGKTFYALNAYASAGEIITNEMELVDLILESEEYTELLQGGTLLDANIEKLGVISGRTPFQRMSAIVSRVLGDSDPAVQQARRNEIAAGKESIGLELKYRPNIASFNAGMPSWDVGFEGDFGFEPILINGQGFTFDLSKRPSDDQAGMRFQAYRANIFAQNSNAADADKARAEIKYLATLDYMNEESLMNHKSMRFYTSALDGNDPLDIFRKARQEYEAMK